MNRRLVPCHPDRRLCGTPTSSPSRYVCAMNLGCAPLLQSFVGARYIVPTLRLGGTAGCPIRGFGVWGFCLSFFDLVAQPILLALSFAEGAVRRLCWKRCGG